ncbi:sortase [bacterium]|nr:sortase [bacterium]
MYDSRYSKFLTILLIVVIVIILGLLIFWGVDSIVKYNVNNDAQDGIDAFKNQIQSGNIGNTVPDLNLPGGNNINNNVVDIPGNNIGNNVVIVDPYQNLITPGDNTIGDGGNNGGGSSSGDISSDGTMYKGFKMVGYIEIPKTDVELPILAEATKTAMETSVCVLTGVGLNEPGITVISGHNYRNGLFFSDNAKLSVGDKIYITDQDGDTVTYEIYKKYQTTPEDASYTTVDTDGKKEIVLTTCTDDSSHRIIICAREV